MNKKKVFGLIIILVVIIVGWRIFALNNSVKDLSDEQITEMNSNIIRKKVDLEKEATDNIAQKIQNSGIVNGKIKVKDSEVVYEDEVYEYKVYSMKIVDQDNKEYEVIVSDDGYYGSIVDEDGKFTVMK